MTAVNVSISGGDAILQRLRDLARSNGLVKAGIVEGSRNAAEVLKYAPIQEFGGQIEVTPKMRGFLAANYGIHLKASKTHITIPARSFLRTTFQEHWQEWRDIIAQALAAGYPPDVALEYAGIRMQDDIIAKIQSSMPPPNSEATNLIKRQEAPEMVGRTLQHTGQLVHSIWYEVSGNDESA